MTDQTSEIPIDFIVSAPQLVQTVYYDWNPGRVQDLMARWHDGETSGFIARAYSVTRNTVMGKIHRLRASGTLKDGLRKPPKAAPRLKHKPYSFRRKKAPLLPPKPVAAPSPIEGGVSIMQLEGHHCRAVTGRGDEGLARYCGDQKTEWAFRDRLIRSSYCAFHNGVYHNPI